MRRAFGFTLIEIMVAMAVIALLAAIAFPSYQDYIRRGIRSQGQQFLMDLAQRQEQYFLDNRSYATAWVNGIVAGANTISLTMPDIVVANYTMQVNPIPCANPCPTFAMELVVIAGSAISQSKNPATNAVQTDGNLVINNLQQRWREVDANHIYNAKAGGGPGAPGDCLWEDGRCIPG